ncbi:uncharacterized protein LOC119743308 [Patiria miniata]|uniref:Uncharacterized protein n=1 Tax=Patiria miniata TaxID=46514 RepID=A0A914BIB2_PATMI|nr:uncharacterized protein LOC119743308 [Patiria miniata]
MEKHPCYSFYCKLTNNSDSSTNRTQSALDCPEQEDHGVGKLDTENSKTLDGLSPDSSSQQVPRLIDAGKDVACSQDSGLVAPNQTPDKPADEASLVEGIRTGLPRVDCSAVVRRQGSKELAASSVAAAVAAATVDSDAGTINTTFNISINATNSPVNFGTTHGIVCNYGTASITDGRGEDVSPEAIQMLTELEKCLGKKNVAEVLSKGLEMVKKQGGLDDPSHMPRLSEASQSSSSEAMASSATGTDATSLCMDVAAASSGIDNIQILDTFPEKSEQN